MKKKWSKSGEKGITLIALIVTIIILLILTSVSVKIIFDGDGLFSKSKYAVSSYNQAMIDEEESLEGILSELDKDQNSKKEDSNQEEDLDSEEDVDPKKEVDPTDVYVYLTTDGTLVFSSSENVLEEGLISKAYGNIKDTHFTIEGSTYTDKKVDTPWFNDRAKIKSVNFINEIAPTTTMGWFLQCTNLSNIENIENLNTVNVTDMSEMFYNCAKLTSIDVSSFDTSKVTNMKLIFGVGSGSTMALTEIRGLENLDTGNVTNMSYMFCNCAKLTSLDVSSLNTENVIDMSFMFYGCEGLTSLNLNDIDTSNVENMRAMFYGCRQLKSLDVSSLNTEKVTNMSAMFAANGTTMELTEIIGLENFDTSNVTDMNTMFQNCGKLTSLNVSSFNTEKVTNMSYMFCAGSGKTMVLTEIIGLEKFNTSKVTDMNTMFQNCIKLKSLNLNSFDTRNVTNMSYMFYGCSSLTVINAGPNWKTASKNTSMFSSCGVSKVTQ